MPRQFFLPNGRLVYRTRLLPYDKAQAFALCLRANTSRFREVDLILNRRAKGEKTWYVMFSPATTGALYDAADREQEKRAQKANIEGRDYLFCLDTDARRPFYRVFNPKSGETYCLTSHECDCPDFQCRLKRASWSGVVCKHIQEMNRRFETGELVTLASVISVGSAFIPDHEPHIDPSYADYERRTRAALDGEAAA